MEGLEKGLIIYGIEKGQKRLSAQNQGCQFFFLVKYTKMGGNIPNDNKVTTWPKGTYVFKMA
jgi:hypothetical protein